MNDEGSDDQEIICQHTEVVVSSQGESCAHCGTWLKGPYFKVTKEDKQICARNV